MSVEELYIMVYNFSLPYLIGGSTPDGLLQIHSTYKIIIMSKCNAYPPKDLALLLLLRYAVMDKRGNCQYISGILRTH